MEIQIRREILLTLPSAELPPGLLIRLDQGVEEQVVRIGSDIDRKGQPGQQLVRLRRVLFADQFSYRREELLYRGIARIWRQLITEPFQQLSVHVIGELDV